MSLGNYKDLPNTIKTPIRFGLLNSNESESESQYDIDLNRYYQTLNEISNGINANDKVTVYQYLKQYCVIILRNGIKISDFRIPEVIELLMSALHLEFDAELVYQILHTINLILNILSKMNVPHPLSLFKNTNIFSFFQAVLPNATEKIIANIIIFLSKIIDETKESVQYVFLILSSNTIFDIIVNPKFPEVYEGIAKLILALSSLPLQELPPPINIAANGFNDLPLRSSIDFVFFYILSFVSFSNLSVITAGYNSLYRIILDNHIVLQETIEHSIQLRDIISRHLVFDETEVERLEWIIMSLGAMCMHGYKLDIYPLRNIIPFLQYNNEKIRMAAAYALCNALASNLTQFSIDDYILIFDILRTNLENGSFQEKAFVSQTIPKVFVVIPQNAYLQLVGNNIFETFHNILEISENIDENLTNVLSAIDKIFGVSDLEGNWDFYSSHFENSKCFDVINELEIPDERLRKQIDEFMTKYSQRKIGFSTV